MATLSELFEVTLRDIYYAEKANLKALPKMAKRAQSDELKAAFEKHLEETQDQVLLLEEAFNAVGKKPKGKKCPAIDGIIEEGEELMDEHDSGEVLDAGLVAAAQAVEHYEIARYRALCNWGIVLGQTAAVKPLQKILAQETKTDMALEKLGTRVFADALKDLKTDEKPQMRAKKST
ncbi:MAG: YciE/YciF ferroxidase family protein [Limisphaerales bacterium]